MVEIFLLEQFVAFAQCGTLSRAAARLHISQPALSRSMKKLEDLFGVPLFDRAKSRIALNETGKVAARYALRVLEADREMVEQTLAFERKSRTIALGACAFLPANALLPILQRHFSGMTIASEIAADDKLVQGLRSHLYQLAVLHSRPDADGLFCREYMDERLCITLPAGHPLASQKTVSFRDLDGLRILAHGGSGFWLELCREHMHGTKLLVEDSMEMLGELVDASSLPVFNSNRAMTPRDTSGGRVTLPIADATAHITYFLACLDCERGKYRAVFDAIRP